MARSLTLDPIADVGALIRDDTLVAFSVGAEGRPYIVSTADPRGYRIENAAGAGLPRVVPDAPRNYRVLCLDRGELTLDLLIEGLNVNVHHVQPLQGGVLLVCSRTYRRSDHDFDLNAHLYDREGAQRSSFLLGDGIQDVQVTTSGTIWTSYFDEGVFGNFGWDQPVGASGLVAWTSSGERSYEFTPPEGLDAIADCYALNVESDEVAWCYYYTDFALVRIRNLAAESFWRIPVAGSSCFAISGTHALFGGGYKNRDLYSVYRLDSPEPELVGQIDMKLPGHTGTVRTVGRGDSIWLLAGNQIYRLSVESALRATLRA